LPNAGKSGSLFFFSHDMKFIVKTLPKREAKLLLEILPNYFQHVRLNPGTYLPRFYGLHRWCPEFP
jgi:1-phosphatidylinositol-4-phosphate 5-kinase